MPLATWWFVHHEIHCVESVAEHLKMGLMMGVAYPYGISTGSNSVRASRCSGFCRNTGSVSDRRQRIGCYWLGCFGCNGFSTIVT